MTQISPQLTYRNVCVCVCLFTSCSVDDRLISSIFWILCLIISLTSFSDSLSWTCTQTGSTNRKYTLVQTGTWTRSGKENRLRLKTKSSASNTIPVFPPWFSSTRLRGSPCRDPDGPRSHIQDRHTLDPSYSKSEIREMAFTRQALNRDTITSCRRFTVPLFLCGGSHRRGAGCLSRSRSW